MKINVVKMTRLISANFPKELSGVVSSQFTIAQSEDYTIELKIVNNTAATAAGEPPAKLLKRDECITELQRWTKKVTHAQPRH